MTVKKVQKDLMSIPGDSGSSGTGVHFYRNIQFESNDTAAEGRRT